MPFDCASSCSLLFYYFYLSLPWVRSQNGRICHAALIFDGSQHKPIQSCDSNKHNRSCLQTGMDANELSLLTQLDCHACAFKIRNYIKDIISYFLHCKRIHVSYQGSTNASLPYDPPRNTENDYFQTFSAFPPC